MLRSRSACQICKRRYGFSGYIKQLDFTGIIKFSSGRRRIPIVMENKQRTLAICIIACLASLPLSSTFVTRDSDTSKNGEKNFDHELQNLIPEQRQQDIFLEKTDEPMNFEEKLPESKIIHDKRINEEEIDEKLNLIKPNSTTENIVQVIIQNIL